MDRIMDRIDIILGGGEGRMGTILRDMISGYGGMISEYSSVETVTSVDKRFGAGAESHLHNKRHTLKLQRYDPRKGIVYVDFTGEGTGQLVRNVGKAAECGLGSVIGTCEWYQESPKICDSGLFEMKRIARENGVRCVWGDFSAISKSELELPVDVWSNRERMAAMGALWAVEWVNQDYRNGAGPGLYSFRHDVLDLPYSRPGEREGIHKL